MKPPLQWCISYRTRHVVKIPCIANISRKLSFCWSNHYRLYIHTCNKAHKIHRNLVLNNENGGEILPKTNACFPKLVPGLRRLDQSLRGKTVTQLNLSRPVIANLGLGSASLQYNQKSGNYNDRSTTNMSPQESVDTNSSVVDGRVVFFQL